MTLHRSRAVHRLGWSVSQDRRWQLGGARTRPGALTRSFLTDPAQTVHWTDASTNIARYGRPSTMGNAEPTEGATLADLPHDPARRTRGGRPPPRRGPQVALIGTAPVMNRPRDIVVRRAPSSGPGTPLCTAGRAFACPAGSPDTLARSSRDSSLADLGGSWCSVRSTGAPPSCRRPKPAARSGRWGSVQASTPPSEQPPDDTCRTPSNSRPPSCSPSDHATWCSSSTSPATWALPASTRASVLPGCGHVPMSDDPARVLNLISSAVPASPILLLHENTKASTSGGQG